MKMTFDKRAIHRDLGYFYLGLILSYAMTGILMNHRQSWHPEKYTVETKVITFQCPQKESEITEEYVKGLGKLLNIQDKFRRHTVKKGVLKISYEKQDVEIDIATGNGEIVTFRKTPFIAPMMQLHKDTSKWWIYYADLFALSLITIAVTGVLMYPQGKLSFMERGWKLALTGLLFPIFFLIFLS
jgi:uncharacterized protein